MSDSSDYRRERFERVFAKMPTEEQRRILAFMAAYLVRLGLELPDELREEGNPLASVYVN